MKNVKYKDVVQKVVDTSETFCDFCSSKISNSYYAVSETTVECRFGHSYPEGGSATTLDVDICMNCFESKLIPWIKSQGVEMRETESDW